MKVCVLGTGIMGQGIVSLFSLSENVSQILWWGRKNDSIKEGFMRVKKEVSRYARRNSIDKQLVQLLLSKISFHTDLSELINCDIYIEAIIEDLSAKNKLLSGLSTVIPSNSIVATNTSSLSITALAMNINQPTNFIGIHFFNPTSVMNLVEIIQGLTSAKETINRAIKIVESLNKSPILVKESPGFIVNRMLIPMINEAISILSEGIACKEDIDKAMMLGANHPIGPLALSDLIGNDVCLSIMEALHRETGDPKYRAHPLLRQYVRAKLLGRKTGIGFFKY